MFKKQIDAIKASKQYRQAKLWAQENKDLIVVGAGCAYVGYTLGHRGHSTTIDNTASPVFNNMPVFNNDNSSAVSLGGNVSKIVKRLEDDELWEKSIDAARQLSEERGITLERAKWLISRNANGHIPHVYGMHYENFGLHTSG